MQSQVRKAVLAVDECKDIKRKDSVFYQVKLLSAALALLLLVLL